MPTLYDFIFIDTQRVHSLYTQIFDGLHEGVEKTVKDDTSLAKDWQAGGPPLGFYKFSSGKHIGETESNRFNPHDLILRDLLGYLKENDMLSAQPEMAESGKLVLISGSLTLLDVGVMGSFLEFLPKLVSIDDNADENVASLPKNMRKKAKKAEAAYKACGTAMFEFFAKITPKAVQFSIAGDSVTAWGSVKQENMRADVAHILLQQGPLQSGTWNVLGIVDAGASEELAEAPLLPPTFEGIFSMIDGVRSAFKRPEGDILITPLLIFRKIS